MFLTEQEIADLTGYKRNADQRRWLTSNGWIFETARTGRPIVSRNYADARTSSAQRRKGWAPNVAAIR